MPARTHTTPLRIVPLAAPAAVCAEQSKLAGEMVLKSHTSILAYSTTGPRVYRTEGTLLSPARAPRAIL